MQQRQKYMSAIGGLDTPARARELGHKVGGMRRSRIAALLATLFPPLALAALPADYDALIIRARAGDYAPVLNVLRQQGIHAGTRAVYDHIVVAQWAGQPTEAVAAYESLPKGLLLAPEALLAAARSYRDLQNWPQALALFQEGVARYPLQPPFIAGEVMTLADAGRGNDAVSAGQAWVARCPNDADARLALAYAYARNAQPYDALFHTDKAMQLAPDSADVQREYIWALQRARLADRALTQASRHPDLLNAAQMRRLQADAVAEQVRMADTPSRGESERFAVADRALARYDELIPVWTQLGDVARDDVIRLRVDRLSALRARVRMTDVVTEYEALRAQGVDVPRYALNDVASAYLYLHQPEKARDIYQLVAQRQEAVRDDPEDRMNIDSGLYYALAESGQYDEADRWLSNASKHYEPWLYYTGLVGREPNEMYLQNLQTGAAARLQADDTQAAQARLEAMVRSAPANSDLRTDLATAYRAQALPRASERALKMAETLSPRSPAVENGQGFTALELREWRQAEELSSDTLARFPEDLSTRRLAREWEVHNKAELQVSGYRGLSNDSPTAGKNDFGIDTVLYSAPIDYNWRMFGGGGYANGDFQEGSANYRWARTGVEWRQRDLKVEGEVSANSYGYGLRPGARVTAAYDLDDHWQIGGGAEILSRETPLRALNSDISSNRAEVNVRWRANEQRSWTLSFAPSHFTDGNNRLALELRGRERLYTAPYLKADADISIATQHNSAGGDVPYFNPHADLLLLPGLRLTHTLYRRYETSWEQIGTVAAGTYSEQAFGTGGVVALGYGQRYRANDVLDMGAMVTGISRPYDGKRERELRVVFDLIYRF